MYNTHTFHKYRKVSYTDFFSNLHKQIIFTSIIVKKHIFLKHAAYYVCLNEIQ